MNIGKVIYGNCNGYFGRYSHGDRIIIGEGHNWIVVTDFQEEVMLAKFKNESEKNGFIELWMEEIEEECE